MKIAVVGIGIAGSYLLSRFSEKHEVDGYEFLPLERFDAVCAWGASKHEMKRLIKPTGLNFEDYILHEGRIMRIEIGRLEHAVKLKGLCTFDKKRLILDLVKGCRVKFGVSPSFQDLRDEGFDLIIDSTGMHRHLLPRVRDDLLLPTVQYRVRFTDPPFDDFYIHPFSKLGGYVWYFPIGNGEAHVGAADYFHRHDEHLAAFLREHPGEIIRKTGRPIRATPPSLCDPFFVELDGVSLVGVGESVGTVFPLLGEGIIPSLQCAEALIQNMNDLPHYRSVILQKFQLYDRVYRLLRKGFKGQLSSLRQMFALWSLYADLKRNEERYGMSISIIDMLKTSFRRRLDRSSRNMASP